MVLDFKITLTEGGVPRPVLHELKVISCRKSRYVLSRQVRAVDKGEGDLKDLNITVKFKQEIQ